MHLADWQREFNRQLGQNIVIARKAAGLSQKEFAARCGVAVSTLCRWEQGDFRIAAAQLAIFSTVLELQPMTLWPQY
jgi:DNA-binding transcriptional regulator YiaG